MALCFLSSQYNSKKSQNKIKQSNVKPKPRIHWANSRIFLSSFYFWLFIWMPGVCEVWFEVVYICVWRGWSSSFCKNLSSAFERSIKPLNGVWEHAFNLSCGLKETNQIVFVWVWTLKKSYNKDIYKIYLDLSDI